MGTKGNLYFPINTLITDTTQGTTYTLKKLIGRGAYAQCFLATTEIGPFAIKIVKLIDIKSEKVREKLKTEIEIHTSLDHPNVVKMYTSFKNSEFLFMVLELCEHGSMDDLLKNNGTLKEKYVSKFVSQLVGGLDYLHNKMSVIHRDLKLGNLFLDSNLNVKIGDFGLSVVVDQNEKRKTICGTPNYIAPEILFGKEKGHSFEADIWSLGVIVYTLLVGKPPFQQHKVEEIYKLIERNEYTFPPDCCLSSYSIDLITRLLTSDPTLRPTLQAISEHRFITHRANFTYRVYKNLFTENYEIKRPDKDFIIYSTPVSALGGIGYVLQSGVHGIYYYDSSNAYLKKNSFTFLKLKIENDQKVFVKEDHRLEKIPDSLKEHYRHILYFKKHYSDEVYKWAETGVMAAGHLFVYKVRKIQDGILFIMANNIFVFDFNYGVKVVVGNEGQRVFVFADEGAVKFTAGLRDLCISILKEYANS